MSAKKLITFQERFDAKYEISYKPISGKGFYGRDNALLREILNFICEYYSKYDVKLKDFNRRDSHITTNMLIPNQYFTKPEVYKTFCPILKEVKRKYKITPAIPNLSNPTTLFEIAKNIRSQISK